MFLAGFQLGLQGGQLFLAPVELALGLFPLGLPLPVQCFGGLGRFRRGIAGEGRGGSEDLQLDGPDAQAVAGSQFGIGERLAVQPRIGRPTANDGGAIAVDDQAMERPDAAGPQPQRALRPGADRALGGAEADNLAIAGRTAEAEGQRCGGGLKG